MKELKLARWILFGGVFLVVIAPILLTRSVGLVSFSETGTIGDTIGGITAPIVGLVGAILVFYALRAQVEANAIIQRQLDQSKADEVQRRELQYVVDLYDYFEEGVTTFTYSKEKSVGHFRDNQKIVVELVGISAIAKLIEDLRHFGPDPHDEDAMYKFPKLSELVNLMRIADTLLCRVLRASMPALDKEFFLGLMNHHFEYALWPIISNQKEAIANQKPCESCGGWHGAFPVYLYDRVERIREVLKRELDGLAVSQTSNDESSVPQ